MVVVSCCLLSLISLLSLLPVFPLVQGTESALMAVHIKLGQLPEAHQVYRSLRASGQWPHPYAMNALLNAYANSFRCVVGGQVQSRGNCSKPTQFTRIVVVAGEEVKQCLAWTRGEEQRQGRAWLTLLARPQRDSLLHCSTSLQVLQNTAAARLCARWPEHTLFLKSFCLCAGWVTW
jgi:hypothetical protein